MGLISTKENGCTPPYTMLPFWLLTVKTRVPSVHTRKLLSTIPIYEFGYIYNLHLELYIVSLSTVEDMVRSS